MQPPGSRQALDAGLLEPGLLAREAAAPDEEACLMMERELTLVAGVLADWASCRLVEGTPDYFAEWEEQRVDSRSSPFRSLET